MDAAGWIARLGLEPHPEGGWFRRIYTDARLTETPAGPRAAATSIHYLLGPGSPLGRLHRNRATILHYLQDGGPVRYTLLEPGGAMRQVVLGREPGQALFLDVPGGVWKGSELVDGAAHALVAEVVVPGFDSADHEFMSLSQLMRDYPAPADSLRHLVR